MPWREGAAPGPFTAPAALHPCLNLSRAPPDLAFKRKNISEAFVNDWRDTMVDQPKPDGAAYLTGWTISGIAVIATIVTVWVLGI